MFPVQLKTILHRGSAWVADNELVLLILGAPFLILRTAWWWAGLIILLLTWAARRVATGRWTVRTPFEIPFLLITASVPLSLWASVDRDFAGLLVLRTLFGIAVVYAIANRVRTERGVWWGLNILALAGVGVAVLAVLGMESPWQKMFALAGLYDRLPHLVARLSDGNELFYLRPGYHPNTIGGMLAMLMPVSAGAIIWQPSTMRRQAAHRLALVVGLALMTIVLVLTQSRTAWVALTAALCVLITRPRRRWPLILPFVALGLGTALFLRRAAPESAYLVTGARSAVWAQSWTLIQAYPVTGTGLDPYPLVAEFQAPFYLFFTRPVILDLSPADRLWVHAHNFWLQTWLDFGLLGLLGAAGLFLAWGRMAARLLSGRRGNIPAGWSQGVLASFVAFAVFGLTDGPFLYRKMTLVLWPVLGLTACLYRQSTANREPPAPARRMPGRERWLITAVIGSLGLLLVPVAGAVVSHNIGSVLLQRTALASGSTTGETLTSSGEWLQRATRFSPNRAAGWREQGRVRAVQGDRPASEAAFDRATKLAPTDRITWYHLGLARRQWGDEAGAIAAWQQADAWLLFVARGDEQAAVGDWAAAVDDYRTAAHIRPGDQVAAARLQAALRNVPPDTDLRE